MTLERVLLRNTVSNLSGQLIGAALVFVSVPFFIHHLGATRYGVLLLLLTYVEAFSLLSLGMNAALIKMIAELVATQRTAEGRAYFSSSIVMFAAGGLVAIVIVFLTAPWVVSCFLSGSGEPSPYLTKCLWIAGAAFFFRFVRQVTSSIPIAVQRFDLYNLVTIGSEVLRVALSILVLHFGYSLAAVLTVTLATSLFACVADAFLIQVLTPEFFPLSRPSLEHTCRLWNYSKFIFAGNLSNRLVTTADTLLITYFLPVGTLPYYAVPYGIGQKLWALIGNVASVVFPAASALTPDSDAVRSLYVTSSKLIMALTVFPALALCMLSRPLLLFWVGPEMAQHASLPLVLLSIAFLANCLGLVPYVVLQGIGYPQLAAAFSVIYCVVNVGSFVMIIPSFGIVGAAAAFLLSQAATVPWLVYKTNCLLDVPLAALVRSAAIPIAIAAVCAGLPLALVYSLNVSLMSVIGSLFTAAVVYTAMSWFIVLDRKERQTVRELLTHWFPGHSSAAARVINPVPSRSVKNG